MAIRPIKVRRPPPTSDAALASWLDEVAAAINGLPISVFSTSDGPNSSNVTAPSGFIGLEIGSSNTKLWFRESTWSAVSVI